MLVHQAKRGEDIVDCSSSEVSGYPIALPAPATAGDGPRQRKKHIHQLTIHILAGGIRNGATLCNVTPGGFWSGDVAR